MNSQSSQKEARPRFSCRVDLIINAADARFFSLLKHAFFEVEMPEKEGSPEKKGEICYCEAHRIDYNCSDGCPECKKELKAGKESKLWKEEFLRLEQARAGGG